MLFEAACSCPRTFRPQEVAVERGDFLIVGQAPSHGSANGCIQVPTLERRLADQKTPYRLLHKSLAELERAIICMIVIKPRSAGGTFFGSSEKSSAPRSYKRPISSRSVPRPTARQPICVKSRKSCSVKIQQLYPP